MKTHSTYADLLNVTHDILSIKMHHVGEEDSFSLGQDYIRWRQSKTTAERFRENFIISWFMCANIELVTGDDPVLDLINAEIDLKIKREAEERYLH